MSDSNEKKYENVSDVLRYQMDRRGLFGAGAAFALGGLLSACTGGGGSYADRKPNKKPEGAAQQIGKANIPTPRHETVIVGQVEYTVFNSFNTRIPNGSASGSGFDSVVKEYMFYLNLATGELQPWLAKDYKYNDDNTELTFTFRDNVKWNDGQPFTAKDFRFTVLLMRDHKELLGGGGDLADFVADVQTPDDYTAVLELKKPNPRFHYGFICTIVGGFDILPEHIWKDQDPTKFRDNPPVRTGPYMLDKAIASQKMFVWKKNPDYWNKAEFDPVPKYVIFQSTAKQQDSASLAFERAEFDVGSLDEPHAKQLRSQGYEKLVTTQFHDPCPRALWLNNDPARGIISEPKMHWVVSYLLDREKIGTSVWPVKVPGAQYPWADYPNNDKWENSAIADKYKLVYDPKKAEALLDEIAPKGGDGKRMYKGKPATIEIITPSPVDGAEYIIGKLLKEELSKLGVTASVRSLSGSVHDEKVERGNFDITSNWVCNVSWDPQQLYSDLQSRYAQPVGKPAVGKNRTRMRDPKMDQLARQLANLDPESPEAKPLLDQALEVYYQRLPVIPVIQTGYPSYFNTTFWTGWPTDDDLYQVPNNWWGQFMFVIGRLKPTGQK